MRKEDGNNYSVNAEKKEKMNIKIGVLALQGAFREHIKAFQKAGAEAVEIKFPGDINEIDGLVVPGGESTTISKLIDKYEFKKYLDEIYLSGKPMYGTCAGMILFAREVVNENFGLGYIDIAVERNSYGRQIDSFHEMIELSFDRSKKFEAIFIRAPRITSTGPEVDILAKINDNIILARQKNILVSSFHPELQDDLRIHDYFLNMVLHK